MLTEISQNRFRRADCCSKSMKDTEFSKSRLPEVILNVPAAKKKNYFFTTKIHTHTNDLTADGNKI